MRRTPKPGTVLGPTPRSLGNPRSLRWKIAAGVAAAACAMALGIGILVHRTTEDRSLSISRTMAIRELDSAEAEFRAARSAHSSPPGSRTYRVGNELPDQLRDRLGSGAGPVTWWDTRNPARGPSMWAAGRVDGEALAVSVNRASEMFSLQALDRHMKYAALATLAVIVPLTLLAAELALRRLSRVAGTARRIRHGDLDARTRSRSRDEIGDISAAVDHMADALKERLHSEQRFTADVAHELRTPLTGLVIAAALLPESEATDLVRDRVQVLRDLVEDLLEISRLDAGAERAQTVPVPLGAVVEEAVARTGLTAEVAVADDATVETDPRRLDRILANLVANAHRHGLPPVTVTVTGSEVVVRDHGSGFPDELLATGPQRFRTGAQERGAGHGLGLTIALGQARVIGAELEFANAPEGGARVTLRLPPTAAAPHGAT